MKRKERAEGREGQILLFNTERTWKYTPKLSIPFDPWSWMRYLIHLCFTWSVLCYLFKEVEINLVQTSWLEIDKTNFPVNLSDWRGGCQEARTSFWRCRVWYWQSVNTILSPYRASLHQIALIYVCQRRCNVERYGGGKNNFCFLNVKDSSWHG